MASNTIPDLCQTYCKHYADYLYCETGGISWAECISGAYEAPPTFGYPFYSPTDLSQAVKQSTKPRKDYTSLVVSSIAGGIVGIAIVYCLTLLLYCHWSRLKTRRLEMLAKEKDGHEKDLKSSSVRHPEEPDTLLEKGQTRLPPALVEVSKQAIPVSVKGMVTAADLVGEGLL